MKKKKVNFNKAVSDKLLKKSTKEKISPKGKEDISTAIVVADLEKEAKPLFNKLNKITTIKTQEDFEMAGEQLKMLKGIVAKAKELENEMTAGIKQSLKKIQEHFKPFSRKTGDLELNIKLMMSNYLEAAKKKLATIDSNFEKGSMKISTYAKKVAEVAPTSSRAGATIRKVWTAVITDENKIPREYLVPDMTAITKACKDGEVIPGVEWKQVDQIAI
jgi:hypothetical protein